MTLKDTALILLIILTALAWGAKEWLEDIWRGLKADTQIKIAVLGGVSVLLLLAYLLRPYVQFFM